jgi:hypothetical protein
MRKVVLGALVVAAAAGGCSGDPGQEELEVRVDPENPDKQLQFETPVFEVERGKERQDCYFITMPDLNDGQPYFVDRVRLGSNPGSHHANVFRVKTIVNLGATNDTVYDGECFRSSNWADWPLVANNQDDDPTDGVFDWRLPDGVAYRFTPGERLMVQTHYVNASTQLTPYRGKVAFDLYRSTHPSPMEMGTLFATQQSIRVCRSSPTPTTFTGGCSFRSGGVTIAAANGHFHSRGLRFDVFRWDGMTTEPPAEGDRFYRSMVWDDPPMEIYEESAGMQIPANGGIRWTCSYEWYEPLAEVGGCAALDAADRLGANDCCYTFGPRVETSEHCNVFLYYYPKVESSDVNCF